MHAALKETLVPALRDRGFRGSLPHFRRLLATRVDLLTVQFDLRGGGFVIEISRCSPEGITTSWGEHIPAEKVTAHSLHPEQRHRLGSPGHGADGRWFRFDGWKPISWVARATLGHLEEADRWWAGLDGKGS
jgi:hypothetical protein